MKEAMFYHLLKDSKTVQCDLCPHYCVISPSKIGRCGIRKNIEGTLYAMSFGRVSSLALDPVEKKPLRLFHPGEMILSVGSIGCNMVCPFCQNSEISMSKLDDNCLFDKTDGKSLNNENNVVETAVTSSEFLVEKAISLKVQKNIGIAYTYNEPLIWYEFVYETSKLAKQFDLLNVLVTNGFIANKPLLEILPLIDAMNIDLKSFSGDFYKNTLKGGLENVKDTISTSIKYCYVEITTLVIPGKNDSNEEIEALCKFISNISPDIPLHLTRFFPRCLWKDIMPTPVERLYELSTIARKYLKHVFIGNI